MDNGSHPWFDSVDEPTLRQRKGAKWNKFPADVLPAWVADTDFAPAPAVMAALRRQLDTGDLGYPNLMVEPNPVAAAFSQWAARRYAWTVDPARVLVTTDVLQPIAGILARFSEPGDGVVIQTPIYPPFLRATDMGNRRLVDNPLTSAEGGYRLDVDGLRRAVDDRTRILLVCNPHNPTGRAFSRAELLALGELAVERDLLVVCDEIWADFIYPGGAHIPFATLGDEIAERTITLTAATKSFSFAGLRLAVAVFGTAELQERYSELGRFLLGGASSPGAVASIAAWTEGDEFVDQMMGYLVENRRIVHEAVATRMPGVKLALPEATYLAWLDCRELVADGRCSNPSEFFLDKARVALNDGGDFGVHGEGFARLNFATSRAVLGQILDRLAESLA